MKKATADFAILAGCCLILLLPFLITGRTIFPIDSLGIMPGGPYGYNQPQQPHKYTLDPTGSLGGDIGWTGYTTESLRHGIIPFWNPFQSLGEAFLAEGGNQIFYPPNWLNILLPVRYWDVLRFFLFFLASCFVYLFAKECGLDRWPALLAGTAIYAQGFFQGFLSMSIILAANTWLPLVLFGMERLFNKRGSLAGFAAIFVGSFMLGTGSHPGLGIVCVVTIVAYAVLRTLGERDIRPAVAMLVPFAAGALCSAPTWAPFLQNVLAVGARVGMAADYVKLRAMPGLFFPFVYGALYSPVFGNDSIHFSNIVYGWIPPGVVFLTMAGMIASISRVNRKMLTLTLLALWFLLWMMNIPPFNFPRHVPMVQRVTLSYLLCSVQVFFCVLAGYGFSMLCLSSKRQLAITAGAWIAFLSGCFTLVAVVLRSAAPHLDRSCVVAGILPNAAWAIAVPVLLYGALFLARRRGLENAPIIVAFALVAGSAMTFFPSGAAYPIIIMTRLAALLAVIICAGLSLLRRRLQDSDSVWVTIAALMLVNVGLVAAWPGWPKRYDPFTAAPYVQYLKGLPQPAREYGLRTILFPDLASRLGLPSMNILTMLLPLNSFDFMLRYVDRCQNPVLFYGIQPEGCSEAPLTQVLRRRAVWDYLGVRDVLGASAEEIKADADAALQPGSDFIAVEIRGLVQIPVVVRSSAPAVEVLMSTAGRKNYGPVRFELKDMDGKTVISRQFEGITLPIEDWIVFAPDSGKIPPGVYTAEVTFTPATAGSAIVMWKDQTLPESYLHRVQIDNAGFKLAYRSPKDQITVWENQSAKPLVYVAPQNAPALNEADAQAKLVAQLDFHHVAYLNAGTAGCESNASFPIGREASAVRSLGITPNAVDVTLEAKSAGTLVYVGSYAKGWMARIDNKPARTFRVNGAFLGTCLPSSGFHQVTFEYRPPLWYPSLAASFGGLLLAGWGWRRRLVARASGGS